MVLGCTPFGFAQGTLTEVIAWDEKMPYMYILECADGSYYQVG